MKLYKFAFLLLALLSSTAFGQKTVSNLQNQKGWQGFALLPSKYLICSTCSGTGSNINWYRKPGISSPSLSGKTTEHHIGGSKSFADVLWNNHIIGDFSSQGIHDYSHTLVPKLHNFVYDVELTNETSGSGNVDLPNQSPAPSTTMTFQVTAKERWKLALSNAETGFGVTPLSVTISWP